jgi:hypothetical protein
MNGWYGTALALVSLSALMSVVYFPSQNAHMPEAVLLSSALQPVAWVAVVLGMVARSKGVRYAVIVVLLIWVLGALLGALIAAVQ